MIVPNFVPGPQEVPGNVTGESHPVRLAFIRRVILLHLAGGSVVGSVGFAWRPQGHFAAATAVLAGLLLVLSAQRIAQRGSGTEARVAAFVLPLVLLVVGVWGAEATAHGWPVWAALVGLFATALYTVLCGRDFSFVGCAFLSGIASLVGVAAISGSLDLAGPITGRAIAINAVASAYWVFDLSMIMHRRRRGEELAAVVDFYRDIFNFFGYIPRVIAHWRKHRIWSRPEGWLRR